MQRLEFETDEFSYITMKEYVSDTTQFIRELLRNHPEIAAEQAEARATWWDRPQDLKELRRLEESTVPKKPYEYY